MQLAAPLQGVKLLSTQPSPVQQPAVGEQDWPLEAQVAAAQVKFTQPRPAQQSEPEVHTLPAG